MKAALAGAAAAAVWQAPRIEGLSVAPDVAQAATGTCVGGTALFTKNSNGALLGRCWGTTNLAGAACGGATVNTALPAAWNFDAVLTFGGEWTTLGASNGFVTIDVNGIDPPFETLHREHNGGLQRRGRSEHLQCGPDYLQLRRQ